MGEEVITEGAMLLRGYASPVASELVDIVAEIVPLAQGDAVIFTVNHRPVRGARGFYRVTLRHGVSRLRSGQRHTLGIIFHDAA